MLMVKGMHDFAANVCVMHECTALTNLKLRNLAQKTSYSACPAQWQSSKMLLKSVHLFVNVNNQNRLIK